MGFRKIVHALAAILLVAGFASCSNTKYLPAGENLYTGAKVSVNGPELSKKKKKALSRQLEALTRPRPNTKILGLRVKLWFWNIAGNPKRKISVARLIKKMGEPPVLASSVNLERNSAILDNTLENIGYFNASVTGDTVVKKRRASAEYKAETGMQYTIREVFFQEDSSKLQKAIVASSEKTLLKEGDAFNLDIVKAERIRIDAYLKERGFYYFNPDFLIIDIDSTIGDNKLNLYVNTKRGTPGEARQPYSIKDVYIYSNYSLQTADTDTNKADAVFYRGYYVVDKEKFYNPRLFEQAMQFNRGDTYNREEHNLTLNRLINLGIFKFVKNRFEPAGDTSLNAFYYLTPQPKKSLRAEIGGNTKSNNLTGTQITVGFTNRNAFRGGEILNVNASVGSEVQYSSQFKGYNTFRIGAEANLALPRFLTPFVLVNPRGGFVPKTHIQLGYDILNRQKLYTLNSFRGAFGYIWQENIQKEHQFYPISVQYVLPIKITEEYRSKMAADPTLRKAVDTQFILGANYSFLYNQLAGKPANSSGIFYNGLLDVSGNIAGLFTKGDVDAGKPARIFGAPFSQYLKLENDFRFYQKVSDRSVWANRIIVGAGFPYGNSRELPFIKQFFIGGNNSLRAFRSRSVGPGTYRSPDTLANFIPDQSGDLKLELNTELRMKLFSVIHGALFVDAGNIWLYNENPLKPGGKFSKDFLKQLAVGAGVGIRVDINILVLRLDVAFPLRKPYLDDKERWVIDKIKFADKDWRKENVIFNLAIGYPF